jgi:biotin carboxyl carrier protein
VPDEPRPPEGRAADHAAIERLADDLVPALIAKLSASGLGEIEVAEDRWTIRVRRPAGGVVGHNRRSTDRASRAQPGHAGHGHPPGGFEGHRSAREGARAAHVSSNGSSPVTADGGGAHRSEPSSDGHRAVATSPAVGVFQPRSEITPGTRVRSGDRLGAVDVLGIPQEVIAPSDGILGANLVEAGQAVEYGQDLIIIELAGRPAERAAERGSEG